MFIIMMIHVVILSSSGAMIIALGLGSLILFSTILLVVALSMRKHWDDLGGHDRGTGSKGK